VTTLTFLPPSCESHRPSYSGQACSSSQAFSPERAALRSGRSHSQSTSSARQSFGCAVGGSPPSTLPNATASSHVAFLARATGRVFRRRTIGGVVLLALIAAATAIPALAALGLVSAVCSAVVAYEALRHRDHRVRHPELAG
jgi:hypothetical protein